jgi:hypothetical protein
LSSDAVAIAGDLLGLTSIDLTIAGLEFGLDLIKHLNFFSLSQVLA